MHHSTVPLRLLHLLLNLKGVLLCSAEGCYVPQLPFLPGPHPLQNHRSWQRWHVSVNCEVSVTLSLEQLTQHIVGQ